MMGPIGLELRRRPDTMASLLAQTPTATAGWILEIIGTEGIGKTTLNNALAGKLRKTWFLRHSLEQFGPAADGDPELEALHRDIYLHMVDKVTQEETDPWKTITLLRQKGRVISESLTIQTHPFPRGFVLDEGLCKGFPREVLDLASGSPDPLWHKRAFVYLRADDIEVALRRYQGRVQKRDERGLPISIPTDAHVLERLREQTDLYDRIIDTATAFGCPTVTIKAEAPLKTCKAQFLEFERGIREGV